MTDIVERLRKGAAYLKFYDCKDAADEIARLRAHNAELREALEDCADDLAAELQQRYRDMLDYSSMKRDFELDMTCVNKARALLIKEEE